MRSVFLTRSATKIHLMFITDLIAERYAGFLLTFPQGFGITVATLKWMVRKRGTATRPRRMATLLRPPPPHHHPPTLPMDTRTAIPIPKMTTMRPKTETPSKKWVCFVFFISPSPHFAIQAYPKAISSPNTSNEAF